MTEPPCGQPNCNRPSCVVLAGPRYFCAECYEEFRKNLGCATPPEEKASVKITSAPSTAAKIAEETACFDHAACTIEIVPPCPCCEEMAPLEWTLTVDAGSCSEKAEETP